MRFSEKRRVRRQGGPILGNRISGEKEIKKDSLGQLDEPEV